MAATNHRYVGPAYFLEFGELRFLAEPSPRFVFYNSLTKQEESYHGYVMFLNTLRQMVNLLPQLHQIAALGSASASAESENMAETENNLPSLSLLAPPADLQASPFTRDQVVFNSTLVEFGSAPRLRYDMEVSRFQGKCYIWLRRLWLDASESTWKCCKGPFRFGPTDTQTGIMQFALSHMSLARLASKKAAAVLPSNRPNFKEEPNKKVTSSEAGTNRAADLTVTSASTLSWDRETEKLHTPTQLLSAVNCSTEMV